MTGMRQIGGVAPRPLERAQLVWRRALALSGHQSRDRFVVLLDLLRTAHHGPSTMLHALALGRAQQRAAPGDIPTRDAVRLLARTINWLGKPVDEGEVRTVSPPGAADVRQPGPTRPAARPAEAD